MNREKIDEFLMIINLPIELGWNDYIEDEGNNWYRYLYNLDLITKEDLTQVYEKRSPIKSNRYIESFLADCDYHFNKGVQGCTVADIGAGWGHLSFWMLINGAEKVYAVGDEHRSEFIQKLFNEIKSKRLLKVEGELVSIGKWISEGDELIDESIPKASLDYCLFNDVFEHIPFYRLPSVSISCFNNLKSGGMLISKTHNTNNPKVLEEIFEYWNRTEETKEIPSRLNLLKELHDLEGDANLNLLAKNTRGMVRSEFDRSVEEYKKTGEIPKYDKSLPSYDIIFDEAHEGPTDYHKTISILNESGFKASVYPAMYNSRKSRIFQGLAKLFPKLFLELHIFDETVCFVARK